MDKTHNLTVHEGWVICVMQQKIGVDKTCKKLYSAVSPFKKKKEKKKLEKKNKH